MTMTMQIKNAKIEEATVGFKYTTAVLCAKLKFETALKDCFPSLVLNTMP